MKVSKTVEYRIEHKKTEVGWESKTGERVIVSKIVAEGQRERNALKE